jgi:hypothetical protein
MVSIRLLEDEYQQLKELCVTQGARSVSDLAREAMFRMLTQPSADDGAQHLAARLRQLDQTVARLGEQLEAMEGRLPAIPGATKWAK